MTNIHHTDNLGGRHDKATTNDNNRTEGSTAGTAEVIKLPSTKWESRALDAAYDAWYADPKNRPRAHAVGLNKPSHTKTSPVASRKSFPGRQLNDAQLKAQKRETKKEILRPGREAIQEELRAVEAMRIAVMDGEPLTWDEARELGRLQWQREKEELRREPIGQLYYLDTQAKEEWIRRHDHRLIDEAAINRTAAAGVVDAALASTRKRTGAPAQHRLACAVAKKLMWGEGPVILKYAYQDLALTAHPMAEWAYGSPADGRPQRRHIPSDQVISENAVRDALNGYTRKNRSTGEREFIPGILDTADPTFFHDLLLDTSIDLLKSGRYPNMGYALSIDGTFAKARKLQQSSVSVTHEQLLNGRMQPEECSFVYHEGKGSVRGNNALVLTDPHGPVHARAVRLVGAARKEEKAAPELVQDHHLRVWERAEQDGSYPFPNERYITGDSAFNTEDFCYDLIFRFGLIPAFPWHKTMTKQKVAWADNHGVPTCDVCEGNPEMRFVGADPIPTPAERWAKGLRPGEDLNDHLDRFGMKRTPRIKFQCRKCPRTTQRNIKDAAHVYSPLPYKDVHLQATTPKRQAQDRYLIRVELLANRNASESLNSVLKYRCWGLQGANAPACIKSYRQMEWITYGRFLSQALRVLVRADGTYEQARDEARHYKLDKPGLFKLIKAARDRLDQGAAAA